MTIEEKRKAIEDHCDKHPYCRSIEDGVFCPLYSCNEDECYQTDKSVEKNYKILFGGDPTFDTVDKAEHYNKGGVECIDAIKASMSTDEYAGFLKGQVIKYVWRYRHKGKPVEDLKKARYYLDKLIEESEDTV